MTVAWTVFDTDPDGPYGVLVHAATAEDAIRVGGAEMSYASDELEGFKATRAPLADNCDPAEPIPDAIMRLCGFNGDHNPSCDTCGLANPTDEYHELWEVCEHCNQCGECGCGCDHIWAKRYEHDMMAELHALPEAESDTS